MKKAFLLPLLFLSITCLSAMERSQQEDPVTEIVYRLKNPNLNSDYLSETLDKACQIKLSGLSKEHQDQLFNSIHEIGILFHKRALYDKAFQAFKYSAYLGNFYGRYLHAHTLLHGQGCEKNYGQSLKFLQLAQEGFRDFSKEIQKIFPIQYNSVGLGLEAKGDTENALLAYKKSCELKHPQGILHYFALLSEDKKNFLRAYNEIIDFNTDELSPENKNIFGGYCNDLAVDLEEDLENKENTKKNPALKEIIRDLYKKSACLGNFLGQLNYAYYFLEDKKDPNSILSSLKQAQAADKNRDSQEDPENQQDLSELYYDIGFKLENDVVKTESKREKAFEAYKRSVELGYAKAYFPYSRLLHEKGQHVESFKWGMKGLGEAKKDKGRLYRSVPASTRPSKDSKKIQEMKEHLDQLRLVLGTLIPAKSKESVNRKEETDRLVSEKPLRSSKNKSGIIFKPLNKDPLFSTLSDSAFEMVQNMYTAFQNALKNKELKKDDKIDVQLSGAFKEQLGPSASCSIIDVSLGKQDSSTIIQVKSPLNKRQYSKYQKKEDILSNLSVLLVRIGKDQKGEVIGLTQLQEGQKRTAMEASK